MCKIFSTFILSALISAFAPLIFSADYYWTVSGGTEGKTYSSPSSACDAVVNRSAGAHGYAVARFVSLDYKSPSQFNCKAQGDEYVGQELWSDFSRYINRAGDSCPSGATYNASAGSCNFPCLPPSTIVNGQCLAPQVCTQNWSGGEKVWSGSLGACVKYPNLSAPEFCTWMGGKSMGGQMEVNSNSVSGPSQFIDNAQCVMTSNTAAADCVSRVNSDGLGSYRCKVTGSYSGDYNPNGTNKPDGYCSSGDCVEPPVKPPIPKPEPSEITDSKPCIYTSGAGGSQSCTSSNLLQKEGTSNCGTVGGVWKCLEKKPTSKGIVIDTKLKTETRPDGSSTTTKTDTAVSTTCKGIGECSSSTTTTTSTTSKNASGVVTGATGSCTGAACPDKNTNPDGDGDGFGDCTGDNCGDEGGVGPTTPEFEDVPTYLQSVETFYGRVSDSPVGTAAHGLRAPSGGQCYAPSVETYLGTFTLDGHCQLMGEQISLIKLIAKTLWALAAFWIFIG